MPEGPGGGLLASLRRALGSVLELAQTRLELLNCEVEQEKLRLFDALWWGVLSLLLLGVGLVLALAFVVLLLQEGYRLPALGVLTLLCTGGGLGLLRVARRRLRSPGGVFAASAGEIARDRAGLASGD
jgi:uncharacterized membrane protein YqjE